MRTSQMVLIDGLLKSSYSITVFIEQSPYHSGDETSCAVVLKSDERLTITLTTLTAALKEANLTHC
jgi:hypothetical protein